MKMPSKIAVLAGGPSCEREISLLSGKAVCEALRSKGCSVSMVDAAGDFIPSLKKEEIRHVFLALHGTFGEDGTVQRLLEKEGVLYTGSGAEASEAAFDKSKAQEIFRRAGIRVPRFEVLSGEPLVPSFPFGFPVVVKPSRSGSSVGVSLVTKAEGFPEALRKALAYSETALVEEYVKGRELTVGFLGDRLLPIVEVIARRGFFDFDAKYKDAATRYDFPASIPEPEASAVNAAALAAYLALGCEVMARVDIILKEGEGPYVLEANTIPGLTGKSLLPKAAQAAGIPFADLCVKIMELSFNRVVSAL